jgi:Acyl-CoA dehydrogenase N terminal
MVTYKAPLRDMRFVLYELHHGDALAQWPGFEEMTPDLIDPVLEEAAKLCQEVLFPLNRPGDEEGCVFENGVVRTPSTAFPICRTYGLGSEIDFVAPSVDDRVTIDVIDELDDALLQLVF